MYAETAFISIIIPVFNEEERLPRLLHHLKNLTPKPEIIIVDGGSCDNSYAIASSFNVETVRVAQRQRARQLNAGIQKASGDLLLFLHADTHLPQESFSALCKEMEKGEIEGGAFHLEFEENQLPYVSKAVALRVLLFELPYGDQAYFITKGALQKIGVFKEIDLMEDVEWYCRLKSNCKTKVLDEPIYTSPRRIQQRGPLRSCLINNFILFLYFLGFDPSYLSSIYYGKHSS